MAIERAHRPAGRPAARPVRGPRARRAPARPGRPAHATRSSWRSTSARSSASASPALARRQLAARPGSPRGRAATRPSSGRGPRLARLAGAIVAVACLAYLVLWWRTVNPAGTVWRAGAWTWPVLALSTAISMLLGHAVTVSTLAVWPRAAPTPARPSLRLPSPLVAAHRRHRRARVPWRRDDAVSHHARRGTRRRAPRRRLPPCQTGVRLTVVAVDGLDLAFLERLVGTGPNADASRRLIAAAPG